MAAPAPSPPSRVIRLRPGFRASLLAAATALVAAGAAVLPFDLRVAGWCKTHRLPGELGRLVNLLEISGHALGAGIALVAVAVLDQGLRLSPAASPGGRHIAGWWSFGRMIVATYLGGLAADAVKLSVERVRPHAVDLARVPSWLGTFGGAAIDVAPDRASDLMSFPSGHTAVAAGLAAALTWRYPHGWLLFCFLAAATATQRVVASAHYPSDVACGAAVGLAAAACCLGGRRPVAHGSAA